MSTILISSKLELRAAKNAVEAMREAQKSADFLEAWSTLVDRLEKVWTKVERECQSFKNKFEPWQGKFKKLRKEDDLLRYLAHARNAEQHTIEMVAAYSPVGVQMHLEEGQTAELILDRKNGKLSIRGGTLVQRYSAKHMLLPFKERAVTYNPPTQHQGVEYEFDPLKAAEFGLAFYEEFVQKVEEKFFPKLSASDIVEAAKSELPVQFDN